MTLLLDTHTLLWFLTNDSNLSARARGAIEDPSNVAHVSAASLWEVAIKFALGKLRLPAPYTDIFPRQLESNGFSLLPISPAHCAALLTLPFHHRDPFDRLLLARRARRPTPSNPRRTTPAPTGRKKIAHGKSVLRTPPWVAWQHPAKP